MRSPIYPLSFMDHSVGVQSKNSPLKCWIPKISSCFFPKSFIILHFTVKSVIHFASVFVQGVSLGWDSFFFLNMSICSSTICWKGCPFPTNFLLALRSCMCAGLFLSALICLTCVSVPPPGPHCFDQCIYTVSLSMCPVVVGASLTAQLVKNLPAMHET